MLALALFSTDIIIHIWQPFYDLWILATTTWRSTRGKGNTTANKHSGSYNRVTGKDRDWNHFDRPRHNVLFLILYAKNSWLILSAYITLPPVCQNSSWNILYPKWPKLVYSFQISKIYFLFILVRLNFELLDQFLEISLNYGLIWDQLWHNIF